jgi:hypothetical protein
MPNEVNLCPRGDHVKIKVQVEYVNCIALKVPIINNIPRIVLNFLTLKSLRTLIPTIRPYPI